jgi:serine/threonine protein kinase
MEPLTGDDPRQVAGYQVRARLGAGGMGRVYLAFTAGGRPVALKVIRPELGDDPDFRRRFRQEVEAARRVSGLYTAQVLDADPDASPPWLVTAYVPGPSLQEAVSAHGPLPLDTVLLLMAGIAEALQAVHAAGLVHRDLKASNVLLAPDGPRVIDFGIARAAEATTVTRTGLRIGSPPYMAPEQIEGRPVSPATDVFALGSVIAYAALGRLPFGTGDHQVLLYRVVYQAPDLDGCPGPLRGLIERCLAKAPADRPSPGEIINECRAGSTGQTLQVAQSWLPAALSADLAQHVPPTQPAPTVDTPWPTPGGVPPWSVPSAPAPAAPTPASWATPPLVPGAVSPLVPGAAPPPWQDRTRPTGARRISPRILVAAAAVVAAAGVGTALAVSLNSGSTSSGQVTADGAAASSVATSSVTTAKSATSPVAAPSTASSSPNPAACLVGTWKAVDQQLISTINGQQVVFTGGGAVSTFLPNGTITSLYQDETFRATISGVTWTEVLEGTATGHWAVDNGDILYSNLTSSGTETLYEDGNYNNSGPLEALPGANPYQCSGNTLRESFPAGGSDQLTRVTS